LPISSHIDQHDDDQPVGRLLSRREMLTVLGGASAVLFVGAGGNRLALAQTAPPTATATAVPTCVVRPELTEGPLFVDLGLNRSDIRIDPTDDSVQAGALLKLVFDVTSIDGSACVPLEGAVVDVWHCSADGVYSGIDREGTADQHWLRGYQATDEFGVAQFLTVYPGWYNGRAVHIHFKIRTDPASDARYEFTSQVFFDEAFTDTVYENEPYNQRGRRTVLNENDGIFAQSDGLLTLEVTEDDAIEVGEDGETQAGYIAVFSIGLDLTDDSVGATDGNAGGGRTNSPRRP